MPGPLDTLTHLTRCTDAWPAAISNDGNYNDVRLKQADAGPEADCNEAVTAQGGEEAAVGRGARGPLRPSAAWADTGPPVRPHPPQVLSQDIVQPVSAG